MTISTKARHDSAELAFKVAIRAVEELQGHQDLYFFTGSRAFSLDQRSSDLDIVCNGKAAAEKLRSALLDLSFSIGAKRGSDPEDEELAAVDTRYMSKYSAEINIIELEGVARYKSWKIATEAIAAMSKAASSYAKILLRDKASRCILFESIASIARQALIKESAGIDEYFG